MKKTTPEKPAEAKLTLLSRFIHAAMDQDDPRPLYRFSRARKRLESLPPTAAVYLNPLGPDVELLGFICTREHSHDAEACGVIYLDDLDESDMPVRDNEDIELD